MGMCSAEFQGLQWESVLMILWGVTSGYLGRHRIDNPRGHFNDYPTSPMGRDGEYYSERATSAGTSTSTVLAYRIKLLVETLSRLLKRSNSRHGALLVTCCPMGSIVVDMSVWEG